MAETIALVVVLFLAVPAALRTAQGLADEAKSGVLFCADPEDYTLTSEVSVAVGVVVPFTGDDAALPETWMVADGRSLSRTTHEALFQKIGTTYGGDGDTFRVPDYRGMRAVNFRSGFTTFLHLRPSTLAEDLGMSELGLTVTNVHWLIRVQ